MARQAGSVQAIRGPPSHQTGVALLGRYIPAHGPSMARLLNVARAIFGPRGIFKREGLSRPVSFFPLRNYNKFNSINVY